jgi:hypothetical protein
MFERLHEFWTFVRKCRSLAPWRYGSPITISTCFLSLNGGQLAHPGRRTRPSIVPFRGTLLGRISGHKVQGI